MFSFVPSLCTFSSTNIPCAMLIFKRRLRCVDYGHHIFSAPWCDENMFPFRYERRMLYLIEGSIFYVIIPLLISDAGNLATSVRFVYFVSYNSYLNAIMCEDAYRTEFCVICSIVCLVQVRTNSRRLVTRPTKSCSVARNICSIITAALSHKQRCISGMSRKS